MRLAHSLALLALLQAAGTAAAANQAYYNPPNQNTKDTVSCGLMCVGDVFYRLWARAMLHHPMLLGPNLTRHHPPISSHPVRLQEGLRDLYQLRDLRHEQQHVGARLYLLPAGTGDTQLRSHHRALPPLPSNRLHIPPPTQVHSAFASCPGADYLLRNPERDVTNTIDLAPYAVVGGLDKVWTDAYTDTTCLI